MTLVPVLSRISGRLAIALVFSLGCGASADSDYRAAELVEQSDLPYPREAWLRSVEAIVRSSYIVTEHGDVADVKIEYSTGSRELESSVERWLYSKKFIPAWHRGQAVESRLFSTVNFNLTGNSRGASRRFRKDWQRFGKSLHSADFEEARRYLAEMEKTRERSLYEELYLQNAWSRYFLAQSDFDRAYLRLRNIETFFEPDANNVEKIVPDSFFYATLVEKYKYEVGQLMLGDAKKTAEKLRLIDAEADTTMLIEQHQQNAMAEVEAREFWITAELREDPFIASASYWSAALVRSEFELRNKTGVLEEVLLYCEKGQLKVDLRNDGGWIVPDSWGDCSIRAFGESGAGFTLVQLPEGTLQVTRAKP